MGRRRPKSRNKKEKMPVVGTSDKKDKDVVDDQIPCCSSSLNSTGRESAAPANLRDWRSKKNSDSEDENDEERILPIPSTSASLVSATSSTSVKENVVPKKKKRRTSASRVVMDYPIRKRRVSRQGTRTSKRPRKSNTSTVSKPDEKNANVGDKSESEEGEDDDDNGKRKKDVYVVERIDGKELIDGKVYYNIKWKGWGESANTWEPLEHLDGCPELVAKFEKKLAEMNKTKSKRTPVKPRKTKKKSRVEDSDDEVDEEVIEDTQHFIKKSFGIHSVWPSDKIPISMEGVIQVDGVLTYVIRKKSRGRPRGLDRNNTILVHADGFRNEYPEIVIKFYQSRIMWSSNPKSGDEMAKIAAQVSLMDRNNGTKICQQIVKDIEKWVKNCGVEDFTGFYDGHNDIAPAELHPDIMKRAKALHEAETQPIIDETDKMDVDNGIEELISPTVPKETDKFGLPVVDRNNEDDSDGGCCSDADSFDFEETLATIPA